MKFRPDQVLSTVIASALALILVIVTLWSPTSFRLSNQKTNQSQSEIQYQEYKKLLEQIKPDPDASKKLFEEIISQVEIKQKVENEFQVKQSVEAPVLPKGTVKVSGTGKEAVVSYFKSLGELINDYNSNVEPVSSESFSEYADLNSLKSAISKSTAYFNQLKSLPVPSELAKFHEAHLLTVQSQKELFQSALAFQSGINTSPWPEVYKQHIISNSQFAITDKEFEQVDKQNSIKDISLVDPVKRNFAQQVWGSVKIKQANAFAGVMDTVVVVGDVPQAVKQVEEKLLSAAYATYITGFLQYLSKQINFTYTVSNVGYYFDSVYKGQYLPNYLDKYVRPEDRELVKLFLGKLTCGKFDPQKLQPILYARAFDHLGFNPSEIDYSSPDYTDKIAAVGEFLATDLGQREQLLGQADAADAEANRATILELTGSGVKSQRDLKSNQISASLAVIQSAQNASLQSLLSLGNDNTENLVSTVVSKILQSFTSNFVFQGAVFQEEAVCTPIPVLDPVIPGEAAAYKSPDLNPNIDQAIRGNELYQ